MKKHTYKIEQRIELRFESEETKQNFNNARFIARNKKKALLQASRRFGIGKGAWEVIRMRRVPE